MWLLIEIWEEKTKVEERVLFEVSDERSSVEDRVCPVTMVNDLLAHECMLLRARSRVWNE